MNYKLANVLYVFKVWEDNTRTQNLVNSKGPLITSRNKYIAIKYRWFRTLISPQIEILRIDTKKQRADIFTKGLTRFNFEQARKRVTCW